MGPPTLTDAEMKMGVFTGWNVNDESQLPEETSHLEVFASETLPDSACPTDDDEAVTYPPGWRRNTKVSTSGRIDYTYSGPNNVDVNSRVKMMKSAVVYDAPPTPRSPPSSPVPQEGPPIAEEVTPRLATVARLLGLTPEQRGVVRSVNQSALS